MSQKLNLFNAGFSVVAPSFLFSQLSLIDKYLEEGEDGKKIADRLSESVSGVKNEHLGYVQTASGLAGHFSIEVPSPPSGHKEYFQWQQEYIEAFEKKFPMNRIDYYYFYYARKLSEIITNVCLAKSYLEIASALEGVDLSSKTDNCLRNCQYIIFRLIAAAALISSEPRLNYFNLYYKQFSREFEKFKDLNVAPLSREEKLRLSKDLETYKLSVLEGLEKCTSILKSMDI